MDLCHCLRLIFAPPASPAFASSSTRLSSCRIPASIDPLLDIVAEDVTGKDDWPAPNNNQEDRDEPSTSRSRSPRSGSGTRADLRFFFVAAASALPCALSCPHCPPPRRRAALQTKTVAPSPVVRLPHRLQELGRCFFPFSAAPGIRSVSAGGQAWGRRGR